MSTAIVHLARKEEGKDYNDFQKVYNAIAQKIRDKKDYDDGTGHGPKLVRLSWHSP